MKRLGIAILLLAGGFLLLMGLNGPPSRYVVEEEARTVRDARREQYYLLTREIARAAIEKADTTKLTQQLNDAMLAPEQIRRGGWELIFLPPGAKAPSDEWLAWGEVDVAEPIDPRDLQGGWRVRVRPATALARTANACGFGP
ncbi:MAG: hypothetical protein ACYS0E_16035 [Planctomycetota bacterium]